MMSISSEAPAKGALEPTQWLPLIEPYLDLQSALADDDLDSAKKALQTMMGITGHSGEAAKIIHNMIAADTLDAIRRPSFETLSNHLIEAVEAASGIEKHTLYKMHCPMVYKDRGADWLQADDRLRNPYYGAMMHRCGELKGEIKPK